MKNDDNTKISPDLFNVISFGAKWTFFQQNTCRIQCIGILIVQCYSW